MKKEIPMTVTMLHSNPKLMEQVRKMNDSFNWLPQTNPNACCEAVYCFDHCEVTVWKDDTVTIVDPANPKSPVLTFRRVPNSFCGVSEPVE